MSEQAFILKWHSSQLRYKAGERRYSLELSWEKPILPISETRSGSIPGTLVFEGNLTEIASLDYPSNNLYWPVMSRRMYDALLKVGSFPHRLIPLTVRDRATGQLDDQHFVAVQLTEHLDLLDPVASAYVYYLDNDIVSVDKIPASMQKEETNSQILSKIVLKEADTALPPLFRLATYPWLQLISAEARTALKKLGVVGLRSEPLGEHRYLGKSLGNGLYSFLFRDAELAPGELHALATGYNWDGDISPLKEIIRSPYCDRGTALLIYWLAEPEFYLRYSSREAVPNATKPEFDLIQEIQRRYKNDYYFYKTIYTHAGKKPPPHIPDIMYEPSLSQSPDLTP